MKKVISVRFKENGKSYYFAPADADIRTGDYVIVETARGIECGEVVQGVTEVVLVQYAVVQSHIVTVAERHVGKLHKYDKTFFLSHIRRMVPAQCHV